MTLTDEATLLSVAPWFDRATAVDLLSLSNDSASVDNGSVTNTLSALGAAGLLNTSTSRGWRVVEPIRSKLRSNLRSENADLYRQALSVFTKHAENGLNPLLVEVMGRRGAHLNVRALRAVQQPSQAATFDEVLDIVWDDESNSSQDTWAVSQLVMEYSASPHTRRDSLLQGLTLWRASRRSESLRFFEQVLSDPIGDRAEGIAAHLAGVARHDMGKHDQAIELLRRAVGVLHGLDDAHGLIVTLTSLGRVLRDRFHSRGNDEDLDAAISSLGEAIDIASTIENKSLLGTTSVILAQCYRSAGEIDAALQYGLLGVELLPSQGRDAVWSRSILAGIYRDMQENDSAMAIAEEAFDLAIAGNVADRDLAHLLNTFAASERRVGRFDEAIRHAEASFHLGLTNHDRRHTAHALHTWASACIDANMDSHSETKTEPRFIRIQLSMAREILIELKDQRGVFMIEKTISRIPS